ncbi:hypothetical protein THAOC_29945, partial [Thalassiosira oceanica]
LVYDCRDSSLTFRHARTGNGETAITRPRAVRRKMTKWGRPEEFPDGERNGDFSRVADGDVSPQALQETTQIGGRRRSPEGKFAAPFRRREGGLEGEGLRHAGRGDRQEDDGSFLPAANVTKIEKDRWHDIVGSGADYEVDAQGVGPCTSS